MTIATRSQLLLNLAKGQGIFSPAFAAASGSASAAAANSGRINFNLNFNALGTTLWATLIELKKPAGFSAALAAGLFQAGSGGAMAGLAYVYKIGTLDLTGTGNKFTHDAATFPVTRTRLNRAANALPLIPLITITTATTVTAPAFILRNATGPSTGYTNQDGNAVQGTKTFTMPAAATALSSTFVLRLEDGDSAITDLDHIDIQTAATAGAATIWGLEILAVTDLASSGVAGAHNCLAGGLHLQDLAPASPTSGSLTSYLVGFSITANSTDVATMFWGAKNS